MCNRKDGTSKHHLNSKFKATSPISSASISPLHSPGFFPDATHCVNCLECTIVNQLIIKSHSARELVTRTSKSFHYEMCVWWLLGKGKVWYKLQNPRRRRQVTGSGVLWFCWMFWRIRCLPQIPSRLFSWCRWVAKVVTCKNLPGKRKGKECLILWLGEF